MGEYIFFTLSQRDPVWVKLMYFGWLLLPDLIFAMACVIYLVYYRKIKNVLNTQPEERSFYWRMFLVAIAILIINAFNEVYGLQTIHYWAVRLGY
jgi:hypothetical protein